MKILKITILMIALSVMILTSCASPVSISGNGKKEDLKKMKHAAILEFIIAPHHKPTFPLIDAAVFNSNLDDIAIEIMKTNNEKVGEYESYFGEKYKKYSGNELLFGEDYYNSELYDRISKLFSPTNTDYDDEDFPEITIVKNSENYFDFFDFDVASSFLQRSDYALENKINVNLDKLDNILNEIKLENALLKIDTEGYELEVLKGANDILKKVDYCIIEVRLQNIDTYNSSELINYLYERNFKIHKILKVYYVKDGIDFMDILFKK